MTLPKIAYFSMEMALDQSLKIYSGGLGFLAGTHMHCAGSLNLPMVGVSMLWSYGYYDQTIGEDGKVQVEYSRKEYDFLTDPNITVDVQIFGQNAKVKVMKVLPENFGTVPIYLLTTDIPENPEEIRKISHKLYDADEKIRVAQETILGIAGVRALVADGFNFDSIHMNEGHALPAAFELLRMYDGDLERVKRKTVFTTHTPVTAGNEIHSASLLRDCGFFAGTCEHRARELGNGEDFSLTVAALRMSRRANAVSQLHGLVANNMWNWVEGRCPIDAITNAVQSDYWQDERIRAAKSNQELLDSKREMKKEVFEELEQTTGKKLDPDVLTVVWARRFADYKRAWLVLMDRERISRLLDENKIQLIFSGKFHPADKMGREMFNNILEQSRKLKNVVVVPNYELDLSAKLKRCSDVWLNTPLRPFEASGTSGMSANMNGSLHVSSHDGWAVEGTFNDINGYTVMYPELDHDMSWEERHWKDHEAVMNILENKIMPTYYNDKNEWARMTKQAIKTANGYFDGDRMVLEYYNRLYNPIAHGGIQNIKHVKFEENPNLNVNEIIKAR